MEINFSQKNVIKINNRKKNKCPTCKNNAIEPYVPFCSKKCSDIDLMQWLSEDKSISDKDTKNR